MMLLTIMDELQGNHRPSSHTQQDHNHPRLTRGQALVELRRRLELILAEGRFSTIEQYIISCAEVGVRVGWVFGRLRYQIGTPDPHIYLAIDVGEVYTASGIQRRIDALCL